jgi:hypothetical protein
MFLLTWFVKALLLYGLLRSNGTMHLVCFDWHGAFAVGVCLKPMVPNLSYVCLKPNVSVGICMRIVPGGFFAVWVCLKQKFLLVLVN